MGFLLSLTGDRVDDCGVAEGRKSRLGTQLSLWPKKTDIENPFESEDYLYFTLCNICVLLVNSYSPRRMPLSFLRGCVIRYYSRSERYMCGKYRRECFTFVVR